MNGFNNSCSTSCSSEHASPGPPMKMSNGIKDFGNQLSNGSSCSSSTVYGGARPKTREFCNDVSNGVQQRHVSSASGSQSLNSSCLETSSLSVVGDQNNLSDDLPKLTSQIRDLACGAGPSQLQGESLNEGGESDASRLAAVCAASSRRAIAERARLAEPGMARRLQSPVDSDSSSDTGNDDVLSGDECCIYTYKGDQNMDISNGLLGVSLPQANEHQVPLHPNDDANHDGRSSPEMDFLEMDFDPDPLGEQDSVEEDNLRIDMLNRSDLASTSPSPSAEEASNELSAPALSPDSPSSVEEGAGALLESNNSTDDEEIQNTEQMPYQGINVGASTSADVTKNTAIPKLSVSKEMLRGQHIAGSQLCPVDVDDAYKLSCVGTTKSWNTNNEPVLDKQKFNLYSALYHSIMANNLILDEEEDDFAHDTRDGRDRSRKETNGDSASSVSESCLQKKSCHRIDEDLPELEKTMIWTEKEACHKQVSQIAVSACGAAAVSNVLCALNIPFTLEQVHDGVATRLRAEKASLPAYLFSRSAAGAAHTDLIRGLELASEGAVYSRFFHMYPERAFSLSRWLAHWIKEGAVPIAILNIQKSVVQGATIPDSWHHQMIFGVSHRGIYLTNPLECVSEDALHPQLCSPSELLIRRQDLVSRWSPDTDLFGLTNTSDIRWKQMNVLGQVVNVLREANARPPHYLFRRNLTSHISIPASYCSGILLSVMRESPAAAQLKSAPELPLKVT